MNLRTIITTTALAGTGLGLWSHAGRSLAESKSFELTPNPLGIKMSPYGQVIAMAIQTPIDADWHASQGQNHAAHDCATEGCTHDHHHPATTVAHADDEDHDHDHGGHGECDHEGCDHDHGHHEHLAADDHDCGHEHCDHEHHDDEEEAAETKSQPLLVRLNQAADERTNPRPPSPAHAFYLRRETEKRLHFAWSLDPSNYANYHAYHLFLSESSVGTLEALQSDWINHGIGVARFTIDYCLRENHDPRPPLTAAVAASNALELMFHAKEAHPISEFQQMLSTLDQAIAKHERLSDAWVLSGSWSHLSAMRQEEVDTRYKFLLRLREAYVQAVHRIESERQREASVKGNTTPAGLSASNAGH